MDRYLRKENRDTALDMDKRFSVWLTDFNVKRGVLLIVRKAKDLSEKAKSDLEMISQIPS